MFSKLPLLGGLALLAACTGRSGPCPIQDASPLPAAVDACHAGEFQHYVNTVPSADVIAALTAAAGAQNVRTIRPGDAVTMDFREGRLNLELGDDGRIKRLRCG